MARLSRYHMLHATADLSPCYIRLHAKLYDKRAVRRQRRLSLQLPMGFRRTVWYVLKHGWHYSARRMTKSRESYEISTRKVRDILERHARQNMQPAQQVTFAQYRLDLPNAQLWRGKRSIPLTNKAFVVLRYLVEHAGQVVSKAELFTALWSGTAVSDGALTFCIVETRKALGDNAKTPRFIETVHR